MDEIKIPKTGEEIVSGDSKAHVRNINIMEIRVATEGNLPPRLAGYAAPFNSLSVDLGGFKEVIMPGAFKRSLTEEDIWMLFDHKTSWPLGRNKAGTLLLAEDERGLKFECIPPETTWMKDVLTSITRGDITGCSFGFNTRPGGHTWKYDKETNTVLHTLKDVQLNEISITVGPAYRETSVAIRSGCGNCVNKKQEVRSEGDLYVVDGPMIEAIKSDELKLDEYEKSLFDRFELLKKQI
jgi:HK97 family phage prohead protease